MIPVTRTLSLDENELEFRFIRASGPGGQNVNKVASAVQLRFDIGRSRTLPQAARQRLTALAGRRVSGEGVLVLTARRFRSQERNRCDVLDRLIALVRTAAQPPKARKPTRPTRAARQRRGWKRNAGAAKSNARAAAGSISHDGSETCPT